MSEPTSWPRSSSSFSNSAVLFGRSCASDAASVRVIVADGAATLASAPGGGGAAGVCAAAAGGGVAAALVEPEAGVGGLDVVAAVDTGAATGSTVKAGKVK